MKKVTRLLILTAFVFPIIGLSRAYAGGGAPHIGQPGYLLEQHRQMSGYDPVVGHDPFRLEDPIANEQEMDRDNLRWHDPFLRDEHPLYGHDRWIGGDGGDGSNGGNVGNGGATAPLDGGISLLLAAGIGLGLKKARARKMAAEQEQKNIENAE